MEALWGCLIAAGVLLPLWLLSRAADRRLGREVADLQEKIKHLPVDKQAFILSAFWRCEAERDIP